LQKVKIIDDEIHERVSFRIGSMPGEDLPESEDLLYNTWLRTELGKYAKERLHGLEMRTQVDPARYEMKAAIIGYMKPKDISFIAIKFGKTACMVI